MNFFKRVIDSLKQPRHQPEDDYTVIITDEIVRVEHPEWEFSSVKRNEINTVMLVNTDSGPWQPDIWLTLFDNTDSCMIPQGANGFDEVYDIVSEFDGFDFENVTKSITYTDNAQFLLWQKPFETPLPNETLITGKWSLVNGLVIGDYNCKRIDWLCEHHLKKSDTKDGGWTTIYQDPQDERYWAKTFPRGEMHGGGPPQLHCVGNYPTQLYKGMTVNERLSISGRMNDFESAIKQNDVASAISILEAVELTQGSIDPILQFHGLKRKDG